MNPKKDNSVLPLKTIQDSLLTTLQLNKSQFLEKYQTDIYTLRKYAIAIFKAIHNGTITNEDTYGLFVKDKLKLQLKEGLPVKIENLRIDNSITETGCVVTVANIHTIKGLEAEAVLAIAKTEAELLLWIETDTSVRDAKRDSEKTDYPRLGYVAFSRAERLLCIGCLEKISIQTLSKLQNLSVIIQ
jgi:DNA helicase-2/ATP-dependent DNA helicase PcrA